MPDEINCNGECSWAWAKHVRYWNFIEENSTCSAYCSCEVPLITGEFDGQVVFTPCQQPTEFSQRLGETDEEYIARINSMRQS